MEIVIIGLVLGFFFAIVQGCKAVGKVYRGRRDRWREANPDAPGFVSAFAAAGDLFAMLRYGPKHFWYGARAGWQMGWQKAKDRTHQYIPPDDEAGKKGEPDKSDAINDWFDHMDADLDAIRRLEHVALPPRTDNTSSAERENFMRGAVEIKKIDDLVKACQDAINDGIAEEKDAAERLARAKQKVAWVTSLVEAMTKEKFPKDQIAIAQSLEAPANGFVKSAEAAKAAATEFLTAAKKALTMAKQHLGLVGQAAGDPYN